MSLLLAAILFLAGVLGLVLSAVLIQIRIAKILCIVFFSLLAAAMLVYCGLTLLLVAAII